ncbi:MAG: CocE/NonD family hydrolase, partial [Bacteroidota bacterium]
MKKIFVLLLFISTFLNANLSAQNGNGQLDDFMEFSTITTVPFTMSDGTKLMTDIYLPVSRDSMVIYFEIPFFGSVPVTVLKQGVQYIIYDSINGEINNEPYRLPLVFTRTPYNKHTEDMIGGVMAFLGYAYAFQDMRGRYSSEGVYLPMYSDGWNKNAYHPEIKHLLDITDFSDPRNGNKHEDGYNSLVFILDSLQRIYQEDTFLLSNGSIGMVGASALGNTQFQLASARKINPEIAGLKSLMPLVATNEHYRYTAVQNGVFRESLITGWLTDMIESGVDDELNEIDSSISNNLHSSTDYGLTNWEEAAILAIDQFVSHSFDGQPSGYYPNCPLRPDMDASFAFVDENGLGDANGLYSRYSNVDVPVYHFTGWWDIFIDGQIHTFNLIRNNISETNGNKNMQKLVIGPWAHQTIGSLTTGDITYKENVHDFIFNLDNIDEIDLENAPLNEIFNSELVSWFRQTLNNNTFANIGEPKVKIPENYSWTAVNDTIFVRVPASDIIIPYKTFLDFITGQNGITGVDVEFNISGNYATYILDVPLLDDPIINVSTPFSESENVDFSQIPAVRLYIPGPIDDEIPENDNCGNYWFECDSFPFKKDIGFTDLFLKSSGTADFENETGETTFLSYIHNPDDPVYTIGGANMIVRTPQGNRKSQGQMDLADPDFAPFTMDRSDVLSFLSPAIKDSLCIIGFPKAIIHASSEPIDGIGDSTDIDFFIRILDVYPDGREYFVVEGAVNARARNYAKQLANGEEDP